jgi:uncharacterized membrane protein
MTLVPRISTRPTVRSLFFLALTVDILLVIAHLILAGSYSFFDLDQEYNLPTYYSSLKLTLVGSFFLLLMFIENRQVFAWTTTSFRWVPFAVIFLYLGLDEVGRIHEQLIDIVAPHLFSDLNIFSNHVYYWVILFAPAMIVAVWYMIIMLRRVVAPGSVARFGWYGLCCFALVPVMEVLGGVWADTGIGAVIIVIEESLEMVGGSLFFVMVMEQVHVSLEAACNVSKKNLL